MQTVGKLVGCFVMLFFLLFVWLSHSGVLPGSAKAHGWGGFGVFFLALYGLFLLLTMSVGNSHKLANVFCFAYGVLLILHAIVFTFLYVANLIGPVYLHGPRLIALFIFYYVLALGGIFMMDGAIEDELVG